MRGDCHSPGGNWRNKVPIGAASSVLQSELQVSPAAGEEGGRGRREGGSKAGAAGSRSLTFACPRIQASCTLRNDELRPGGRSCHPTQGASPQTPSGGALADTHRVGSRALPTQLCKAASGSSLTREVTVLLDQVGHEADSHLSRPVLGTGPV